MKKIKVIIDTDPGKDDAMALLMALASPKLEVLAITTVCGNTALQNTTNNAQFVIRMANSSVNVYAGSDAPLVRKLQESVVHGKSGMEGVQVPKVKISKENAEVEIRKLVEKYPSQITLVTLGPLTNVAKLLLEEGAELKFKRVVSMCGAINVDGNMPSNAEFNAAVDPEALMTVLESDCKQVIVPLDVCNHLTIPLGAFNDVANNRIRKLLLAINQPYVARLKVDTGINESIMYDPAVIYYLLYPENFTTESMRLDVDEYGRTTRSYRKKAKKVDVTLAVNASSFRTDFVNILNEYAT